METIATKTAVEAAKEVMSETDMPMKNSAGYEVSTIENIAELFEMGQKLQAPISGDWYTWKKIKS